MGLKITKIIFHFPFIKYQDLSSQKEKFEEEMSQNREFGQQNSRRFIRNLKGANQIKTSLRFK